ncbi:MAG: hypothetical protein NTW10_05440 [Bacteroidetes bacterium]|nr:hypothetical protein [Bacteroidota bacterium]
MEAIGINRFLKVYKVIYKISIWGKKSVLRMILVTVPFFIPFAIAIPTQSTIIIALMLPALTLLMGLVLIIDHPDYYEDLIRKKTEQHKIGPLGFVIMLIGFIFQLTSVVWQMCVNL